MIQMRQMPCLWSVSCHTPCSISGVTSVTATVLWVRSSTTFVGKCGMNKLLEHVQIDTGYGNRRLHEEHYLTLPLTWNVLSSLKFTVSRNFSSSYILWNICTHRCLRTTSSASIRCWTMDSLYACKCQSFRHTGHSVTFGIPVSQDSRRVDFRRLRTKLTLSCYIDKKHIGVWVTWRGAQIIRSQKPSCATSKLWSYWEVSYDTECKISFELV
jgi:hypothetical protein